MDSSPENRRYPVASTWPLGLKLPFESNMFSFALLPVFIILLQPHNLTTRRATAVPILIRLRKAQTDIHTLRTPTIAYKPAVKGNIFFQATLPAFQQLTKAIENSMLPAKLLDTKNSASDIIH